MPTTDELQTELDTLTDQIAVIESSMVSINQVLAITELSTEARTYILASLTDLTNRVELLEAKVNQAQLWLADMQKSVYDTDNDGIVDGAESLDNGVVAVTAQDVYDHIADDSLHLPADAQDEPWAFFESNLYTNKVLGYDVDGNLDTIDIYSDAGLLNLVYNKQFNYTLGDLTSITLTRVSDAAVFTQTFVYDVDGNVEMIQYT